MVWIFIGGIACVLFGWYLYWRSRNDTSEDTDQTTDAEANNDEFGDLLWTGVLLNEVYDDEDQKSSDDMASDDNNLMDDGGFDDSGGFE